MITKTEIKSYIYDLLDEDNKDTFIASLEKPTINFGSFYDFIGFDEGVASESWDKEQENDFYKVGWEIVEEIKNV
jgi:hypothetical protein